VRLPLSPVPPSTGSTSPDISMCFSVLRNIFHTKTPRPSSRAHERAELNPRRTSTQENHSPPQIPDQTGIWIDEHKIPGKSGPHPLQGNRPSDQDNDAHTAAEGPFDGTSPEWKTITWNAVKVTLGLIKESADVFPPLKAVAGGLCELISNCEVCRFLHRPFRI
jgi:hypothetical protein